MSHEDMDNLLYDLYGKMTKGRECSDLSYYLTIGSIRKFIDENVYYISENLDKELIEKTVTEFLAYNIYKKYKNIELSDSVEKILYDFEEFVDCQDIHDYVKEHLNEFSLIISEYFNFHKEDYKFQCMTYANVVNQNLSFLFRNFYPSFFTVNLEYNSYLLSKSAIIGLDLLEYYNVHVDDDYINIYLHNEFENKKDLYSFLNYILSNVYANLKINGCKDSFDEKLFVLTPSIDKRMKCFYDDKDFVVTLVKKYNSIYNGVKWENFSDIRNMLPIDAMNIIYKLDPCYKHPCDVIKNATYVSTFLGEIQDFIFDNIEEIIQSDGEENEVFEWLINLVDGNIKLNFSYDKFFDNDDKDVFIKTVKIYLASLNYEYLNYKVDDLNDEEEYLYNYLDSYISSSECLELYDDDEYKNLIVNNILDYFDFNSRDVILSRKKMVEDNKFNKILKFNPLMYLEYRRVFGSLLPLETSKSTEYGNSILGALNDIFTNSSSFNDNHEIIYEDVAQTINNESNNLYMTDEEIAGFIISNIYENLKNKKNLIEEEKNFISLAEEEKISVDDILSNDDYFGKLLFVFYSINDEYFSDDKFRKLRRSNTSDKIKVLKKYDPFYDEDFEILK